ncbi:MAG TPA: DUF3365 domain-containing protein [Pirellulales bacterium]|nr:DUF3365 domain-containing protein [Pirellulales bacterium]
MVQKKFATVAALGFGLALAGLLAVSLPEPAAQAADPAPEKKDPAVERTRKQVKMLDDLYKTTIVFITNTYVDSGKDVAAGEIARDLFKAMSEKGWHDARLVDATGHPTNDENAPRDGFEKAAVKKILAGEKYVDEIKTEKGKPYLLAATVVPVVNQKCILCHPTWKVGEVAGALTYKLPIE